VTELREVLSALVAGEARFVVIGGVALRLQGSAYVTLDLDPAYERTRDNARRAASALAGSSLARVVSRPTCRSSSTRRR
jgi:hypothetical protein